MIYLDTHVVVWPGMGDPGRLSARARDAIDAEDCKISPMVMAALDRLHEIGRVHWPANRILGTLHGSMDLRVCEASWSAVVERASSLR